MYCLMYRFIFYFICYQVRRADCFPRIINEVKIFCLSVTTQLLKKIMYVREREEKKRIILNAYNE